MVKYLETYIGFRWDFLSNKFGLLSFIIFTLFCTSITKAQFDRNWKVYLVPFSHTDVGYTTTVNNAILKHEANFDEAMKIIESTKNDSIDERFKWTVEIPWALKHYFHDRSAAVVDSFINYVKNGDIEIGALQFNLQSDLCGNEELVHSLYYAQMLRDKYGIKIRTGLIDDTPGFTWGLSQLLSKSGIPYLSIAMNSALSNFYSTTNLPYLFYWESQNGDKTLVWRCMDNQWAYLEGIISDQVYATYNSMQSKITSLLTKLQGNGYPYDAIYINCATGDNGDINTAILNNVKQWNQTHTDSKLIISTPSEFFDYISQKYSSQIPTYKGDAPNWWTWFFAPSSTGGFSISRKAQNTISEAEKFSSLAEILNPNYIYPTGELDEAYYNNLLYEDHNLGSVDASGNKEFWVDKINWVNSAFDTSNIAIDNSLNAISSEINTGNNTTIAVFNSSGWIRNGIANFKLNELSKDGISGFNIIDPATGNQINYQILVDSTVVFDVEQIPAVGYKIYRIETSSDPINFSKPVNGAVLENQFYRLQFNQTNGGIVSVFDKQLNKELTKNDGVFNLYSLNSSIQPYNLQIIESDSGAIEQRIVLRGDASGTNFYQTEIILPANQKTIIFKNKFDKTPVASLESIDYKFNFNLASPTLRYEIPFGNVEIYKDELSGFKTNHYAAQKWLNVSSSDNSCNITLALGNSSIIANPSGSFNGSLRFLVTYNDNNSAYRAGTGIMEMNYAVTSSAGPINIDSSQMFGYESNNQIRTKVLLANQKGSLSDSSFSLIKIENPALLLSTIKKAENGIGYIFRIFNPTQNQINSRIHLGMNIASAFETTPLERNINTLPLSDSSINLTVNAYDLKTLRIIPGGVTGVKENIKVKDFTLFQNYPNPFNPSTIISFSLPYRGIVSLKIYDVLGREIQTIYEGEKTPGTYKFNFNAEKLASGIYFYRLSFNGVQGNFNKVRKMLLVK